MLPINSLYLDNVGYAEAYFSDATLEFHNPSRIDKKSLDTLISLENTGGKSTLISFILSMFVPSKSRFIQHLQESNHKFEDYFHSTPGLILLKMELPEDKSNLFSKQENNYLILGQYIIKSATKTTRHFFSFESNNSFGFNNVPSISRENIFNEDEIKKWLHESSDKNSTFFYTEKHTDWVEKLNQSGIDTWLAEKQVEFCSAEGGIEEFIHFSSEKEFLKEFFYMAIHEEDTNSIRESLKSNLEKLNDMPKNNKKLELLNDLYSSLNEFTTLSSSFIESDDKLKKAKEYISTYHNLFNNKKDEIDKKIIEINKIKIKTEEQVSLKNDEIKENESNIEALTINKFTLEIEEKRSKIEEKKDALEQIELKLGSLKVSLPQLKVNSKQKEIDDLEKSIEEASKGLEPLRQNIYKAGYEYKAKVEQLLGQKNEEKNSLTEENELLDEEINNLNNMKIELDTKEKELISLQSNKKTLIENRNKKFDNLIENEYVAKDDIVLEKLNKYKSDEVSLKNKIKDNKKIKDDKSKELQELLKDIGEIKIEEALKAKDEKSILIELDTEKSSRKNILEYPLIKLFNNYEDIETIATNLLSKLEHHLSTLTSSLQTKQITYSKIEDEIILLEKTGSKLIDENTEKLLKYLLENGIVSAKLFTHYLSDIYQDDYNKIKSKIESNPSIYLGISVNSEDELKEVENLANKIDFLNKPIVVSTTNAEDTLNIATSTIISPSSDKLYSQKELSNYLDELKDKKVEIEKNISTIEENISVDNEFKNKLDNYFDCFGNGKLELIDSNLLKVETRILELNKDLEDKETEENVLSKEIKNLEKSLEKEQENLSTLNSKINEIENFYNEQEVEFEENQKLYRKFTTDIKENRKLYNSTSKILNSKEYILLENNKKVEKYKIYIDNLKKEIKNIKTNNYKIHDIDLEELKKNDKSSYKSNYKNAKKILEKSENNEGLSSLNDKLEIINENLSEFENELQKMKEKEKFTTELINNNIKLGTDKIIDNISTLEEKEKELIKDESIFTKIKEDLEEEREKFIEQRKYPDKYLDFNDNITLEIIDKQIDEVSIILREIEEDKNKLNKIISQKENEFNSNDKDIEKLKGIINRLSDQIDEDNLLENNLDIELPDLIAKYDDIVSKIIEDIKDSKSQYEKMKKDIETNFKTIIKKVQTKEFHLLLPSFEYNIVKNNAFIVAKESKVLLSRITEHIEILRDELSKTTKHLNILIKSILGHVDTALLKLNGAVKNSILPESLPAIGNKPALKISSKINNTNIKSRESAIRVYIDNLLSQKTESNNIRIPAVNRQLKDEVTTELVYACLGLEYNNNLGIKLIKLSDSAEYYPIAEIPGSGGQRLTSALLLYLVMAQMRAQSKTGKRQITGGGFLLLDNPFGKATKAELVASQIGMGEKLGFQLIYASGIQDHNAQILFKHRISLKRLRRDTANKRNLVAIEETFTNVSD